MSLSETAGEIRPDEAINVGATSAERPASECRRHYLVPSLYNRQIDEAKLPELADSIRSVGILQPILVRPLTAARLEDTAGMDPQPIYEIVAGERRWRASALAGLEAVPIIVRPLTDAEVIEAQLVENLQREELHPLDEAYAYQRLVDEAGVHKDDIAAKVGKGRTYVYDRLKLLRLTPESKEALRAGKGGLDASKAVLLATVADTKLQAKALAYFTETRYDGAPKNSYRDCGGWLRDNVLLKIKEAPFDTKRADLVEGCGSCQECPKRTHADRDLLAAFDGPDLCIDPPCYRQKEAAHLAEIKADAAEQGMDVIAGKQAAKLKGRYSDDIKGYVRLDARHADGKGGEATIGKLLGSAAPKPVLFVDPVTQKKTKVLPTDIVGQLLKERGLTDETPAGRNARAKERQEREDAKEAIELRGREIAVEQVGERLRDGALSAFSAPLLRIMLGEHFKHHYSSRLSRREQEILLQLWRLPAIEAGDGHDWKAERERIAALHARTQAAPDEELGPMLLQVLVVGELDGNGDEDGRRPYLDQLAGEVGVDLPACTKLAKQEHKDRTAAAAKPAKRARNEAIDSDLISERPEAPGATSEAAPQGSEAREKVGPQAAWDKAFGGGRKGSKRKAAAPAAAPLSIAEAKQGIAAAMQGDEDQPGGGAAQAEVDTKTADMFGAPDVRKVLEGMPHVNEEVLANLEAAGLADPVKIRELTHHQLAGVTGLDDEQAAELLRAVDSWPWATVAAAQVFEGFVRAPYGLEPGKRVRVLDTVSKATLKRWVGKEGEILNAIGDRAFDVSFKLPKGGKVVCFDKDELEVVQEENT